MDPLVFFGIVYLGIWLVISAAWWGFKADRFGISGLPIYLL
jgi:hypothetical protein